MYINQSERAVDIFRVAFFLSLFEYLFASATRDKGMEIAFEEMKYKETASDEIKWKTSIWKELTVWNMVTILNSLFKYEIKTWKYFAFAFFVLNIEKKC